MRAHNARATRAPYAILCFRTFATQARRSKRKAMSSSWYSLPFSPQKSSSRSHQDKLSPVFRTGLRTANFCGCGGINSFQRGKSSLKRIWTQKKGIPQKGQSCTNPISRALRNEVKEGGKMNKNTKKPHRDDLWGFDYFFGSFDPFFLVSKIGDRGNRHYSTILPVQRVSSKYCPFATLTYFAPSKFELLCIFLEAADVS